MSGERKGEWLRNERLEGLLAELADLLGPVEDGLRRAGADARYPVVLIVGAPRSGTTVLLQWLAATGCFAYPTNLLSRFYGAPAVGARIQLLLTDERYGFRDELFDLRGGTGFTSDLGKTRGALAPNEFWYFWRRFLPADGFRKLSAGELAKVDGASLRQELAAMEAVFDRPFAMKAAILQYDLAALARFLPNAFFLHVEREPVYNVQSLLEARVKFFGDREHWYSVRPPGHEALLGEDPVRQVAGQVALTEKSLARERAELDDARSLDVRYESFCEDPGGTWAAMRAKLAATGFELPEEYAGPRHFENANELRLNAEEAETAAAAFREYSRGE